MQHSKLENSFKQYNIGPDNKMIPLDDPYLSEENKNTAVVIRKTTTNLVRQFLNPQM